MLAKAFAERLHRYREDRGLSQRQLALMAGVPPIQVSRYERGVTLPAADSLAEIAKVLRISIDALLLGKANREPEPPLKNVALMDRLREIDGLDRSDQETVINIVDALIARRQVESVAARRAKARIEVS